MGHFRPRADDEPRVETLACRQALAEPCAENDFVVYNTIATCGPSALRLGRRLT
jgi:hypothetical protein